MPMNRSLLASLLLALTAACGSGEPPAEPESADGSSPESSDSNVFTPLTDTIDRAESVQSTVDERAEELGRAIEEAEGR